MLKYENTNTTTMKKFFKLLSKLGNDRFFNKELFEKLFVPTNKDYIDILTLFKTYDGGGELSEIEATDALVDKIIKLHGSIIWN